MQNAEKGMFRHRLGLPVCVSTVLPDFTFPPIRRSSTRIRKGIAAHICAPHARRISMQGNLATPGASRTGAIGQFDQRHFTFPTVVRSPCNTTLQVDRARQQNWTRRLCTIDAVDGLKIHGKS